MARARARFGAGQVPDQEKRNDRTMTTQSSTVSTFQLNPAPAPSWPADVNRRGLVQASSWQRLRAAWGCGLLALLLALPLVAQAQFDFTTNNGAITIAKYTGTGGAVVIPSETNGLPVDSIAIWAFRDFTNITSVTIPDSITRIGVEAFYGCTGLTDVTIPGSVTNIERGPFTRCDSLTTISVEASNTAYCSLDGVLFNKAQTTLVQAPLAMTGSYVVPSGVTNIAYAAFYYCVGLTNITLPSSVVTVEDWAIASCESLTKLTIPNGVQNFKIWAVAYCFRLSSVTIPGSVASVGDYAFRGCTNLASATISNGVASLGFQAFDGCDSLTSVAIPASVTNIGASAFADCFALTAITVAALNPNYASTNGALFNKSLTTLLQCPGGKAGSYTIPGGVTNIGAYAFSGCPRLSNVTIPGSVTSIQNYAFYYCPNLTGVYFTGNAPTPRDTMFSGSSQVIVYYLPGTTGWSGIYSKRPTVLWNPQVLSSGPSFGVRTNRFGFIITGSSNLVIVVEAATNLLKSTWVPVGTNTLTSGASYFSDAGWTNYRARYYRLRSP